MALTVNGNTIYAPSGESDSEYAPTNNTALHVSYILLTPSATAGTLTLEDGGANTTKVVLKVPASSTTVLYDLSREKMFFPNGVRITTSTCEATLVIKRSGS